jgi:hypothetical protein
MIINTYATEQVARFSRQDREVAAAASRIAREVRASRWQRSTPVTPTPVPTAPVAGTVRIPRQRGWSSVRVPSAR